MKSVTSAHRRYLNSIGITNVYRSRVHNKNNKRAVTLQCIPLTTANKHSNTAEKGPGRVAYIATTKQPTLVGPMLQRLMTLT